jgi:hypothetical protein
VVGLVTEDKVCITTANAYCIGNLTFLTVTNMRGFERSIDGIIGLALDNPENGPNYVNSLYDSGAISQKIFGVILGTIDNIRTKSSITFGGWDDTMF